MKTGMKHDQDKPRYDLLPASAIDELAKVLTFGAGKYAPNSWQNVTDGLERYRAALLRHTFAIQNGEAIDSESGLQHSAHAMCCAAFIIELEKVGMNQDRVATQTPEEKEALIDTTPHQYEMSKFSGNKEVEWVNDLPPIGGVCEVYGALGKYDEWQKCEVFAIKHGDVFISNDKEWVVRSKNDVKFRKPESEAEKAEREQLESAYELYMEGQHSVGVIGYDSFDLFKANNVQVKFWLAIVDKTKYRKEVE